MVSMHGVHQTGHVITINKQWENKTVQIPAAITVVWHCNFAHSHTQVQKLDMCKQADVIFFDKNKI